MSSPVPDGSPLVCNLSAMNTKQRQRHEQIIRQLFSEAIQETQEQPDGFGFRGDAANFLLAAEFITLERLCCSFFNFTLTMDAGSPSFWLHVTGPAGVKALLQSGFGGIKSASAQVHS